jgi:hypothetical protein
MLEIPHRGETKMEANSWNFILNHSVEEKTTIQSVEQKLTQIFGNVFRSISRTKTFSFLFARTGNLRFGILFNMRQPEISKIVSSKTTFEVT